MKHLNFKCQEDAIAKLKNYSDCNARSILIEGVEGSGKSYLALLYAHKMLHVEDCFTVSPTVQQIRAVIEDCYKIDNPIVIVVENLDLGVAAASYTLLKFLEEPASNVYVVVTCRNINKIPDTIISRSLCVSTAPPIDIDIETYATELNFERFYQLHYTDLWKCAHTFKDVSTILNMNNSQVSYFDNIKNMLGFRDSISNMMWKLGHYEDNSEAPIDIVIEYIMYVSKSNHIKQSGIACLRDISSGRIASHAAIAKFLFECKYCE